MHFRLNAFNFKSFFYQSFNATEWILTSILTNTIFYRKSTKFKLA